MEIVVVAAPNVIAQGAQGISRDKLARGEWVDQAATALEEQATRRNDGSQGACIVSDERGSSGSGGGSGGPRHQEDT